ncbi:UNVERIFIED_CONTAM: hypothetical protein GTU68_052618 [Idotea baltica]|nr:hypothetical protein [Idotea baltica]
MLIAAAQQAVEDSGVGSTASALVCGRSPWHTQLEQKIAAFEGQDAALLFPSGYAANLGIISALTGPSDVLFCDQLNHACLIDGSRLSRADRVIYESQNTADLRRLLESTNVSGRRWIVTDAVFSMDGQIAPLAELCDLADEFDATVIIDEAHGTGVFGKQGRGVIRTGTLSKAIGCLGGFVSGSEQLIDFLWHKARTQFFSTALPPAVCASAAVAFQLIQDEPHRREHLYEISQHLRMRLGLLSSPHVGRIDGIGPIVPVVLHDALAAVMMADRLREAGFLVAAIRPPTVPPGTSRLRISLTAAHSMDDVNRLMDAIGQSLPGATY